MTTMELIERGIGHNCLSDAYDLGRADVIDEILKQMEQEEEECENAMCSPSFWSAKRIVKQMLKEQNGKNNN